MRLLIVSSALSFVPSANSVSPALNRGGGLLSFCSRRFRKPEPGNASASESSASQSESESDSGVGFLDLN